MKKLIHEEPFEESGKFWLPDAPDLSFDGTLRYTPGAFTEIELMGSFLSDHESARRPVVHGRGMNGQEISLLGAVEDLVHSSSTGTRGRIEAECLLVGGHCKSEATQRFTETILRFTSLEQWYGKQLFVRHIDLKGRKGTTIEHVYDDLSSSFRSEALQADIEFFLTEHSSEPSYGEIRAGHETRIRIRPDIPKDLAWFDERRRSIQRLMILLVGDLVEAREMYLRETDDRGYAYGFVDWLCPTARKAQHRHRMPFAFSRVQDRFSDMLDAWFGFEAKCEDAIMLLFSTLITKAPQPYEFLSLVQAVEGILRPLRPGTFVSDAEFQLLSKALVDAIPPDVDPCLRQALKDRLRFGNEWSLRRRLKEGVLNLSEPLQKMVLGKEVLSKFVGATVEGRNFWTHYDANEKAVLLTIPQASIAASRLLTLGVVLLLRQLGISDAEIHERLSDKHFFLPAVGAYSFRDPPPETE